MVKSTSLQKLSLLAFTVIGLAGIWALPHMLATSSSSNSAPSVILVGLVGLFMILIMAAVVSYIANLSNFGLGKRFLALFVIYNALVLFVKFNLAPLQLYNFQDIGFNSHLGSTQAIIMMSALIVFCLYALVYSMIYKYFNKMVLRSISETASGQNVMNKQAKQGHRGKLILFGLIALGLIATGGLPLLFLVLFATDGPLQYFQYIFTGPYSILVSATLTLAIVVAHSMFSVAAERSKAIRDASLLSAVFWFGLTLLAIYHIIWVVYMLVLVNLWPIKTVVPK